MHEAEGSRRAILFLLLILGSLILTYQVLAIPSAPTITLVSNSTSAGTGIGTLFSDANLPGGYIVTMNLNAIQQNTHWRGFVGNVTGAFALQDAAGFSLYEWAVSVFSGEVYATRVDDVRWANLTCANAANVTAEELEFQHNSTNNPQDTINVTFFEAANHAAFSVGDLSFSADQCNYSTRTYVNGTAQSTLGTTDFDEILLYDNDTQNLVYVTIMENNVMGFNNNKSAGNRSYDYQMLLPENATKGIAASATPFYFYVELL